MCARVRVRACACACVCSLERYIWMYRGGHIGMEWSGGEGARAGKEVHQIISKQQIQKYLHNLDIT